MKKCTGPGCDGQTKYAIEYKTIALPYGIAPFQDLVRLSVYSDDDDLHMNTRYLCAFVYYGFLNEISRIKLICTTLMMLKN